MFSENRRTPISAGVSPHLSRHSAANPLLLQATHGLIKLAGLLRSLLVIQPLAHGVTRALAFSLQPENNTSQAGRNRMLQRQQLNAMAQNIELSQPEHASELRLLAARF